MLLRTIALPFVLCLACSASSPASLSAQEPSGTAAAERFELRDGDRVVLLGGTLIERDGQFGDLETALTAAYRDRKITFRNLGWSGDTVWAESRGIFDPPAAGYQRMLALVKELQPTVVLLSYGQNESFAGQDGLPRFVEQYNKLCDDLAATGARLVFLTPMPWASASGEFPATGAREGALDAYADAVRELGGRRGKVLDIAASMSKDLSADQSVPAGLFDGMHLSAKGYQRAAIWLLNAAGLPEVNFNDPAVKQLQAAIIEKNLLFFHRWRPQNVTYLFLFRKHEQGNNAVDIPEFDALAKAADEKIAELRAALSR